jgi:phage gp36-like protein
MAVTVYATVDDLTSVGINRGAIARLSLVDEINPALEAASRVIDRYIKDVFTLPLLTVDKSLARCCAIIAAYDLMSGRGYNADSGTADNLRLRYKDELDWLQQVAEHALPPPDATGSPPGGGASVGARASVNTASSRGFSARGQSGRRWPFQSD